MSLIKFIDEDMIRAACKDEQEVKNAISICAKFCVKTFTFEACIAHPMEVSTFCATTIVLARSKQIKGRKDGVRDFSIKEDLQNELVRACHCEEHPLPILGHLRSPQKCNYQINEYKDEDTGEYWEESEAEEFIRFKPTGGQPAKTKYLYNIDSQHEDAVVFSFVEQMIIRDLDGNVRASSLMQFYNLKRAEAEAVANNIKKKFIAISEVS